MIILAIYYTFADIVLLLQCFYYRGFTLRDPRPDKVAPAQDQPTTERTPLISNEEDHARADSSKAQLQPLERATSQSSFRERVASLDFSPATPIHLPPPEPDSSEVAKPSQPRSWSQAILFNGTVILVVIAAGIAGYYLSPATPAEHHKDDAADEQDSVLVLDLWGQIFGYLCAVLYLASRVPQLLLNYRRKSTDGLNALFFLFACIGNLTYVCSIFAFEPICSSHYGGHWHESNCKPGEALWIYRRYIVVNLSWVIGSAGTLFLDLAVFAQFFLYKKVAGSVQQIP